jgi:hypothetical protein
MRRQRLGELMTCLPRKNDVPSFDPSGNAGLNQTKQKQSSF